MPFHAALLASLLAPAAAATSALPPSPSEIVAAAPAADWTAIPASDLLVMTLAPDAAGRPRRVVIQLMPAPFSAGWVRNIRKLAAAHWYDGTSVNRVQDNYVVQWGDATEKKALPPGLETMPESAYVTSWNDLVSADRARDLLGSTDGVERMITGVAEDVQGPRLAEIASTRTEQAAQGWHKRDSYAEWVEIKHGWPIAAQGEREAARFWPVHCYGTIGVGRDVSPNTGTGAELYVVIGHAPRHLDRNIAVVGRVIEGIEFLSSLPRGTEALGFYKTPEERTPILSIRLATELPAAEQPSFEYLSTETATFARYTQARANRHDTFFIRPAGGVDVCNVPVPVRRVR